MYNSPVWICSHCGANTRDESDNQCECGARASFFALTDEMKALLYKWGRYEMTPPPVYTGNWTKQDWINHVSTWDALPHGGDVVEMSDVWEWGNIPVGGVGIIGGFTNRPITDGYAQITFNYSAFRGRHESLSGRYCVSVSGGPGTIGTPIHRLILTARERKYHAWDWGREIPGAGKGQHYEAEGIVFTWDGKDK